ncbi:Small Nuclear ribonucleoprotein G [Ceraceosorus bombacis]|uniref:Small nuclear ribonucleoprotein G n=1 Tax=Ceraceosorus bombacis TaxID=401625 RepID=A0A0P1B9K1_9BASI|nr:Small Nuclear ribonucleoprotein G [Ceraceosorus bombacis]
MSKVSQPELKKFLDKRISVNIQAGRKLNGTLRGYDMFLNLVVDEAVELVRQESGAWKEGGNCGTVVIRGNSVTSLEGLEQIKIR